MRRTAQIMLMWFHITWHITGQEWKRKQKDKDWVTVERFRSVQGSFIHHPQSGSKPILLFSMQGNMPCLCWWFFLFSPPFTVNKSYPVLTRHTCHQWRLPFHRVILEQKSNCCFAVGVTFLCVMSRCLLGRCARSWLRTPGLDSKAGTRGFSWDFSNRKAPSEGHVRQ